MATTTLVTSDIDVGRRIVAALNRGGVPVTVYIWAFVSQLQEWQFFIASPLVDAKGPLSAYGEVQRVLEKEGVYPDFPLRRIFLKSPNDRVMRLLEKQSKAVPQEDFQVVNAPISGNFVEDAYLYTGSIDIIQMGDAAENTYSIIYLPYSGRGGVVPHVSVRGIDSLRDFLEHRVRINRTAVDEALRNLAESQRASIPNVQLKVTELRRLGLV